ncbi:hypothetical protein [Brevundimonas sp. GCM10030266]|uniref:hypothetical protein n=1 Tax=Brevundimonas sp. GCM10030266 TaxID=3273386 RepID=UPI003622D1A0
MLDLLAPVSHVVGRRNIRALDPKWLSLERLREALPELADADLAAQLTAPQLAELAKLAWNAPSDEHEALLSPLRSVLATRWDELGSDLVWLGLDSRHASGDLFKALPQLSQSDEIYEVIGDQPDGMAWVIEHALDLTSLPPPRLGQLRRLLPRMTGRNLPGLASAALLASASSSTWSTWLTMATILWRFPELADPAAPDLAPADQNRSGALARADATLWRAARGDATGRALGRLLLDLKGELARSPPDFRDVYLDRLRSVVDGEATVRAAALEGLLWLGKDQARDIAVYAAGQLAQLEDREVLRSLEAHPDRQVQYSAGLVGRMIDGAASPQAQAISPPSTPPRQGRSTTSRTWLGDARLEQAIEDTITALEVRFSEEYATRHKAGEDRLGERFFAILGDRFEQLNLGMGELAAARGDEHRASVRVGYRPVDRGEEGKRGIKGRGRARASASFAADFCLVITAVLNGKTLAKRAALVQAKRLYLKDNDVPAKGWNASFELKSKQTRSLLDQTESAFFVFQAPPEHGRKLATLPARLVNDLAQHQAASGGVIAANVVDMASESFAEWFTYQFVALRTGDPFAELVKRAEGGSPDVPYDLVRCGVVDVEVRVGEPKDQKS